MCVCVCRGGVLPHWTECVSRAEAGSLVPVCGPQCSSPCSGQVLSSVCSACSQGGVTVPLQSPGACRPLQLPLGTSSGTGCQVTLQYSCLENPMDGGAW